MAHIPYTPEIGCKYTMTGSNGTVATFNDPTDPNYVGMLTDVTGLDSASVREVGDDLTQTDGGWHGSFYFGRRPITMSGIVISPASATDRAARVDRLRGASACMRSDGVLSWAPSALGSVPMRTWFRRQQPTRITGAWNKDFQVLMISQFAPLFSDALHTTTAGSGAQTVENQGDYAGFPVFTLAGNGGTPEVQNTTTGQVLLFLGAFVLASGRTLTVDTGTHRAYLDDGTDETGNIDFVNTIWPQTVPGLNTFTASGVASYSINYRDTWV